MNLLPPEKQKQVLEHFSKLTDAHLTEITPSTGELYIKGTQTMKFTKSEIRGTVMKRIENLKFYH